MLEDSSEQHDHEVPEELQKSHENKKIELEKAQDKIDGEVKKGEAFLVAIGYISFLCILPLVLLRDSKFAQFHGKQALVLAIFIYFIDVFQAFHAISNSLSFIPLLPTFMAMFSSLYTIFKTLILVYAIYMSFNGRYFKIPFIYKMSERFNINISKEDAPASA